MDRRSGWQRLANVLPGGASRRMSRALRGAADQLQTSPAQPPLAAPERALPAEGGSTFIRERALRSLAEARQTMTGLVGDPPPADESEDRGAQAALRAEISALRGSMSSVQAELTALREELVTLRVTLRAALIGGGGVADTVPEADGATGAGAGSPIASPPVHAEAPPAPSISMNQRPEPAPATSGNGADEGARSAPSPVAGAAEALRAGAAGAGAGSPTSGMTQSVEATDGAWSEESSGAARPGDASATAMPGPLPGGAPARSVAAPAEEPASAWQPSECDAGADSEPAVAALEHASSPTPPTPAANAAGESQPPAPDSHEHEYRALRARWFAAGTVGTRIALRPAPAPDALQQMLQRLQREPLVEHAEALPEEEGAAMLRLTLRMPLRWDDFGGLVERVLGRPLAEGEAGWARGAVRIRLAEAGRDR